jgi:UPF0716 protein FxsA
MLFVVVPLVELRLLFYVSHEWLGSMGTILLVVMTGMLGAAMARQQGVGILQQMKEAVESGRIPGDELIHGVAILVGGVVLVTPGILTDSVGFALLFPPTRLLVVAWIRRRIRFQVQTVSFGGTTSKGERENSSSPFEGPIRDVQARVVDSEQDSEQDSD